MGNSLIGNSSRNDTTRRSFQIIIRGEVHSHFLIIGNYYNGEREIEDTKILIDTGASCNLIQADRCEMIGSITGSCHGRVIRNQQYLFPILLLLP